MMNIFNKSKGDPLSAEEWNFLGEEFDRLENKIDESKGTKINFPNDSKKFLNGEGEFSVPTLKPITVNQNVTVVEDNEDARVEASETNEGITISFSLPKGDKGDTGKVYVPTVDEESGDLSWNLQDNPQDIDSTNIKGPQGERGVGLAVNYSKSGKTTTVNITTDETTPQPLKTFQINDGNDGHNPCLGVFADESALPTTGVLDGDYAYAEKNGASHIFRYSENNSTWIDNGEGSPDKTTKFNGGNGPAVSDMYIDNTNLNNPSENSLAKALDVKDIKTSVNGYDEDEYVAEPDGNKERGIWWTGSTTTDFAIGAVYDGTQNTITYIGITNDTVHGRNHMITINKGDSFKIYTSKRRASSAYYTRGIVLLDSESKKCVALLKWAQSGTVTVTVDVSLDEEGKLTLSSSNDFVYGQGGENDNAVNINTDTYQSLEMYVTYSCMRDNSTGNIEGYIKKLSKKHNNGLSDRVAILEEKTVDIDDNKAKIAAVDKKLEEITFEENKVVGDEISGYWINSNGQVQTSSSGNSILVIPLGDAERVRFLGVEKNGNSSNVGYCFGTFVVPPVSTPSASDFADANFVKIQGFAYNGNASSTKCFEISHKIPEDATHLVLTLWAYATSDHKSNFYCYLQKGENLTQVINTKIQDSITPLFNNNTNNNNINVSPIADCSIIANILRDGGRAYYLGTNGEANITIGNKTYKKEHNYKATEGYLDNIIRTLPNGRHFILFSDIHYDYIWSKDGTDMGDFGPLQKQHEVMRYCYEALGGCKVVFLGDFIGMESNRTTVLREYDYFVKKNYGLFGSDFIYVIGGHDEQNKQGEETSVITRIDEDIIYEKLFKPAKINGAVFDEIAMEAAETANFGDDTNKYWKAVAGMSFYKDDDKLKARIISISSDICSGSDSEKHAHVSQGLATGLCNVHFVCKALETIPDDYTAIICFHTLQRGDNGYSVAAGRYSGLYKVYQAAQAFKSHSQYTLSKLSDLANKSPKGEIMWNAIDAKYETKTFNYNNKSGKIIILNGHRHRDAAWWADMKRSSSDTYALYGGWEGYFGTPSINVDKSNAILTVEIDRAILASSQNSSDASNLWIQYGMRRAPNQYNSQNNNDPLLGSVKEVLFDIVTLKDDDTIVFTRVGNYPLSGSANDYECFDETKNYEANDIVAWRDDTNYSQLYKFTANHEAGAWLGTDVEPYTLPSDYKYIRTYSLETPEIS